MPNGPADVAVTVLDCLGIRNRKACRMDQPTDEAVRLAGEVGVVGVPASMLSTAFSWRNVIDRRNW